MADASLFQGAIAKAIGTMVVFGGLALVIWLFEVFAGTAGRKTTISKTEDSCPSESGEQLAGALRMQRNSQEAAGEPETITASPKSPPTGRLT